MKKLLILSILSALVLSSCGKKEKETPIEISPDIFTEIESRTYEFEESEGNNNTNVGEIYGDGIDLSNRKKPDDSIGDRYYYSEDESFLGIGNTQEDIVNTEVTESETESYESEYTDEVQTFEFDDPDVVDTGKNTKENLEKEIDELIWKLKDGVDDFISNSDLDTARSLFSFNILEYTANVDYDFNLTSVSTSSNGVLMIYDAPNDVQLVLVQATPDTWQKINYSVDQVSRLYINDTNIEYANFSQSSLYARWMTDDAVYIALAVNCGETGFSNILCDLV